MKLSWQHIVLIVVLISAGAISSVLPNSEKTLIIVVTAVLAAYFGPAAANKQQQETLSEIAEKTDQVQKQTNGVLDRRIQDAVRKELDAHPGLRDDNGNRKGASDVAH